MNQHTDNSEQDFLWSILANPADAGNTHADNLQQLVNQHPQSGILRALLVSKGSNEHLQQAAAYFNPATLYKIVNSPDDIATVNESQVIYAENSLQAVDVAAGESFVFSGEADAATNYFHADAEEATSSDSYIEHEEINEPEQQYVPVEDIQVVNEPDNTFILDDEVYDEITPHTTEPANNTFAVEQDIDDEVYEEIVGIEDINLEQVVAAPNASEIPASSTIQTEAVPVAQLSAHNNVSRYNDEKMPYSFLWWLDKTRKEHAGAYQPYTTNVARPVTAKQQQPLQPNINITAADELQQQYYENIFNSTSINAIEPPAPQVTTAPPARKEDIIIERFIQEEPQIKHPSTVKLTGENKAKKSSEDRNELVTETLAKIYTEQMLYHKAISTYKKLMLKYPEKSVYFAGQIEKLENKIN